MNEKNLLRNMYFVVICAIVALIAIVYNGTYAFFVSSITDNGGNRSAALTSANDLANVTLTGDSVAANDKMIPGDSITRTFTLKNSSTTKSVNVKLVWSSVTNTFEDKDDLVFTLKSSANTSTNLVNETKFPTAVADIANNITLAPSANVTYTLTVTYKNNSSKNQNTDMGKAFSGTITVKPAS